MATLPPAPGATAERQARYLRVAFWNVQNLFEPGVVERGPQSGVELSAKLAALSGVVGRLFSGDGPDIIAFAEIQSEQLLRRLCRRLRPKMKRLTVWEGPGTDQETGLAVLARADVVASVEPATTYRPVMFARPRCMVVRCTLRGQGEPFLLAVNHWKSRRPARSGGLLLDPEQDRRETARWLGDLLATSDRETCVIVLGDFNAEPFEGPFNELSLRGVRFFSSALWRRATPAYLYNTAWRFLPEPDLWETTQATRYQPSRPRTSHDASPAVIYDQILVSGAALRGGPITLIEASVSYYCDNCTSTLGSGRALVPFRWKYEGRPVGRSGASDHFPIVAKFVVR